MNRRISPAARQYADAVVCGLCLVGIVLCFIFTAAAIQ